MHQFELSDFHKESYYYTKMQRQIIIVKNDYYFNKVFAALLRKNIPIMGEINFLKLCNDAIS